MKNNGINIDALFNAVTAKTLKSYREKSGMSLEEIAKKMEIPITRQSLFKYENNLARIKNNIFIEYCKALHIDSYEIFKEIAIDTAIISPLINLSDEQTDINIIDLDNSGNISEINILDTSGNLNILDNLYEMNKDKLTDNDIKIITKIIENRKRIYDKEINNNETIN